MTRRNPLGTVKAVDSPSPFRVPRPRRRKLHKPWKLRRRRRHGLGRKPKRPSSAWWNATDSGEASDPHAAHPGEEDLGHWWSVITPCQAPAGALARPLTEAQHRGHDSPRYNYTGLNLEQFVLMYPSSWQWSQMNPRRAGGRMGGSWRQWDQLFRSLQRRRRLTMRCG